mmetsp:Transcript_21123/g.42582  ORF Transcript_21123/g.42582 Transcript_21123/m.42582 type:complete len:206 (+) Transcript_21123:1772-2389(+)
MAMALPPNPYPVRASLRNTQSCGAGKCTLNISAVTYSIMTPRPQRANPITDPARNATLKQGVHPGFCASTVVRTFENTATFIPRYPLNIDVSAPNTNEMAVKHPRVRSQSSPQLTSTKITIEKNATNFAHILYSALKNDSAPTVMASYTSTILAVVSSTLPAVTLSRVQTTGTRATTRNCSKAQSMPTMAHPMMTPVAENGFGRE